MAEIKNTFLKGKMNQDLDARLIPSGEYREAINLSISRSEGSTVGEFENILGNTVISNLEDTGVDVTDVVVIGYFVDESNNVVYCMATNSVDSNYILKIDFQYPYQKTQIHLFLYQKNLEVYYLYRLSNCYLQFF